MDATVSDQKKKYRENAKKALSRKTYITNQEHDNGLIVCQTYRDLITDDEFSAINYLCMAFANDEGLDRDLYETALGAIRRARATIHAGMA